MDPDLTYSVKSEHIPPELCETIKMELMITKLYIPQIVSLWEDAIILQIGIELESLIIN